MKSKVVILADELHDSSVTKFFNGGPSMVGFAIDRDSQMMFTGGFTTKAATGIMLTLISTQEELTQIEKDFLLTLAEKFKT